MPIDPVTTAAVIGVGSQMIGGYLQNQGAKETNAANLRIARETNQFNAQQAQLNRDYQTSMSNTQHQREVADLKKAGLNPILAAQGGAGTPSGSVATGATATMENPMAGMATHARDLGMTVTDAIRLRNELEASKQQQNLAKSQARRNDAETAASVAELPYSKTKGEAFKALGRILKKVEAGYAGTAKDPGLLDLPKMIQDAWTDKVDRDTQKKKMFLKLNKKP